MGVEFVPMAAMRKSGRKNLFPVTKRLNRGRECLRGNEEENVEEGNSQHRSWEEQGKDGAIYDVRQDEQIDAKDGCNRFIRRETRYLIPEKD